MRKKLKIGIDVDNVIADTYYIFLQEFNKEFNTSILYAELVEFNYLERLGYDPAVIEKFWKKILNPGDLQMKIPPFQNSHQIIKRWRIDGHKIHFVTARPTWIEYITKNWLAYYGLLYDNVSVYHFDEKQYTHDTKFKKTIVEKESIEVFIEDSREIAEILDIPVFLLDQPWNQGKLPKNVTRVKNWDEIEQQFDQLDL